MDAAATAARLDRLRACFEERQIDQLLVTNGLSRRYLSGFTGSNGQLLIGLEEARVSTDFRYWEQVGREAPGFALFGAVGPVREWFAEWMRPLGGQRVGFEATDVSYDLHREMREQIATLPAGERPELIPTTGLVEGLRALKEPGEVAALQRTITLADEALADVVGRMEASWTEARVAWELERYVREHGGEGMSFTSIIACGPRGAMPHARATDAPLEAGRPIVIDMGALLDGYCSDMTRTVVLGEPDERFAPIYDIVLTAQLTAIELIEPGMTGEAAHELAHAVIREAGYGEEFGHGLGHGIGLQIHETPWLRRFSEDVLAEGMVFSVEPGIYLPDWGGVRIEDLVVLENGRCRPLTGSPK